MSWLDRWSPWRLRDSLERHECAVAYACSALGRKLYEGGIFMQMGPVGLRNHADRAALRLGFQVSTAEEDKLELATATERIAELERSATVEMENHADTLGVVNEYKAERDEALADAKTWKARAAQSRSALSKIRAFVESVRGDVEVEPELTPAGLAWKEKCDADPGLPLNERAFIGGAWPLTAVTTDPDWNAIAERLADERDEHLGPQSSMESTE